MKELKGRLVIVDDDSAMRSLLEDFFQDQGFAATTFGFAGDALKALGPGGALEASKPEGDIDVIISDIKMPQMDGMELLRRVRELGGAVGVTPVIFLTSKDDELDEALGLAMGADDYIAKPFSQRLLIARIRALLRRRDLELSLRLPKMDDPVDRLNRNMHFEVAKLADEPRALEWGMHMNLAARALERVGDNAVDIGEQVAFLVSGEFREFTDASHPGGVPSDAT